MMATLNQIMRRLNLNTNSRVKLIKKYNDEIWIVNINGCPFATTKFIANNLINICNKD